MPLLLGDIGGTNCRLAMGEMIDGIIQLSDFRNYSSEQYAGIDVILSDYTTSAEISPKAAALAVAGPVNGRICQTTNLPWLLDADTIQQQIGIAHVELLNDLEAIAWGVETLTSEQLLTLHPANNGEVGNRMVIAPGTGLGEAGLYWDGERHHPFPSEGGHADFAASTPLEFTLLQHLQQLHGHVSWERVVSGPGIGAIYDFLIRYRETETPEWLQKTFQTGDRNALITEAALAGRDRLCEETLDLFIYFLAAEAGNQALNLNAKGGIYIAGGIPPKIIDRLQQADFLQTLWNKGRMSPLLKQMPVYVILDDRIGLQGAANYLFRQKTRLNDPTPA